MDNKTIEERSFLYAHKKTICSENTASAEYCKNCRIDWTCRELRYQYVEIATEQRDIDIKAAEDWFCLHECKHTGCVDDKTCGVLEGLRNAMKGGNK